MSVEADVELTELGIILAVVLAVVYIGYKLVNLGSTNCATATGITGTFCKLFGGPTTASGTPSCVGLGCTGQLIKSYWCTAFPSTCSTPPVTGGDTSFSTGIGGGAF